MDGIPRETGPDLIEKTLKEFFTEFTIEELIDMYKYRMQDDLSKESLKEFIMERLELPDEDSFKLYIELL